MNEATGLPGHLAGPPPDTRRRTRVMTHTCEGPIVVVIDDLGGWRYVAADGIGHIGRCPHCHRRLTRRSLKDVDDETVRSDAR